MWVLTPLILMMLVVKQQVSMIGSFLPGDDWNTIPTISRITAERYLSDGFTLQLAGSLNRITQVN